MLAFGSRASSRAPGGSTVPGVAVLRSQAETTLMASLAGWPVPSRSAGSTLVRREGDMLLGVMGRKPLRLDTPELLAGRVLRGELPFGRAAFGRDSRGVEVFGVVVPVKDSEWFLVSKVDADEARDRARCERLGEAETDREDAERVGERLAAGAATVGEGCPKGEKMAPCPAPAVARRRARVSFARSGGGAAYPCPPVPARQA